MSMSTSLKEIEKTVVENTTNVAVICEQIKYITGDLHEIKTNHLVHIADDIKSLIVKQDKIRDDLGRVKENVASRSPLVSIGLEIIKTVIIAVVVAGLTVIGLASL